MHMLFFEISIFKFLCEHFEIDIKYTIYIYEIKIQRRRFISTISITFSALWRNNHFPLSPFAIAAIYSTVWQWSVYLVQIKFKMPISHLFSCFRSSESWENGHITFGIRTTHPKTNSPTKKMVNSPKFLDNSPKFFKVTLKREKHVLGKCQKHVFWKRQKYVI